MCVHFSLSELFFNHFQFFFSIYRNSDTSSNYVDRVRIRDPTKQNLVATPGRGSGWRQKSLSNIDLTSNHKTNGVFRYRDFDGICDLYSKHGDCAEYDDLYGVNPKGELLLNSPDLKKINP